MAYSLSNLIPKLDLLSSGLTGITPQESYPWARFAFMASLDPLPSSQRKSSDSIAVIQVGKPRRSTRPIVQKGSPARTALGLPSDPRASDMRVSCMPLHPPSSRMGPPQRSKSLARIRAPSRGADRATATQRLPHESEKHSRQKRRRFVSPDGAPQSPIWSRSRSKRG